MRSQRAPPRQGPAGTTIIIQALSYVPDQASPSASGDRRRPPPPPKRQCRQAQAMSVIRTKARQGKSVRSALCSPPLRSMRKQGTQKTTVLGSADCYPPPPGRAPGISPGTKPPTSSSKGNLLSLHVFGARGAKLTDLPDRPPYRIMMDWDSASRLSPGASSGTERWVCAPQRGVRFIRKRRDHDQKAAACQLVVTGYEKETRSDGARVSPHTHPRLQVGIGTLLLRVCSEWLTPRRCYVSAPCLSAYGSAVREAVPTAVQSCLLAKPSVILRRVLLRFRSGKEGRIHFRNGRRLRRQSPAPGLLTPWVLQF